MGILPPPPGNIKIAPPPSDTKASPVHRTSGSNSEWSDFTSSSTQNSNQQGGNQSTTTNSNWVQF